METSCPAIQIQNLRKNYGSVQALRGVNLEVKQGEIFGFLGPNGAGKTTTIRCMLGLIRPNSGSIEILGQNPQERSAALHRRVSYLPGELNLEGNMTVDEQLKYIDALRGRSTDWAFLRQITERLALDVKMPIKNLSKGNKQKVGIVQAFMGKPELLLLDEPTSGLDPLMQQEVYQLALEAQAQGATIFFSSHIIREIESIAARAAILRSGEIVQIAERAQLARMAIRKVRIRFKQPVDAERFSGIAGVSSLTQSDPVVITLKLEGDMDQLIKTIAAYPVQDVETEQHSLEEIFLRYYRNDEKKGAENVD